MTDRSGQQLGNYKLIYLLGQGGFADVYLAEHVFLKTHSAIKILRTQVLQKVIDDFLKEAQTLAHLRSANIVRVRDFGIDTSTNTLFLVMDYAPHGSLRQLHPSGSIVPLSTVVSYVRQVAAALQHAHDAKVIHRDVKPENMLVGYDKEVILGDFGLTAVAYSTTSLKTQGDAGTILYMAPEQISGKPRAASDQYALGISAYEWLCGTPPFTGTLPIEIAMKHVTQPPPPMRNKVPTLAPEIEQVILKALEKEPERRFARVQDFADALEEAYKALIAAPSTERVKPTKTKEQWLDEGYRSYKAQQYKEALVACTRAIELDSAYAMAYVGRGIAHNGLKEYKEAIADFDMAIIKLDFKTAEVYYNRGVAYAGLQNYQKAVTDFDKAIKLNPDYTEAYIGRGYAYDNLSYYEYATDDFDHVIQAGSESASVYINRGNLYYKRRDYERAIKDYDRAVQLDPDNALPYYNRGIAHYNNKKYQEAIQDFNHALELAPEYIEAYVSRGNTYGHLKEYQRAIQDYDRALELDPNNALARSNRETASRLLKGKGGK